jgi:uncharacterized repeat protein (TIGR01451 family)
MMKTRYTLFLKLIGSLFAIALLAAPSLGVAFTISQVRVVVGTPGGPQEYCDTTVAGCTNIIWNLNGGVTLSDGQTFILTQTGNPNQVGGENFDTSDRGGVTLLQGCSGFPGQNTPCTVQVYINTGSGLQLVSTDDGNHNPLSAFNEEPTSDETTPQAFFYMEAAPWVRSQAPNFTFTGTNFTLDFGYSDNVHGDACPATADGCFPQPVWCSAPSMIPTQNCPSAATPAATWFLGAGIHPIGNCGQTDRPGVQKPLTDSSGNVVNCYDAGALRITAHPPHLTVLKTPKTGTFTSGSQISYTVVVSNDGAAGSVAHNVQLNDALPGNGGLVWATATPTQGTCTNPIVSNTLHCNLGDIAAGGSVTVTITSTATTPAAACQDQPNPAANATDNEGDSATDFGDQSCTPPNTLGHGDTATIGFWANKNGQGVINCENGGPSSTALGNWLASNFPNLFGNLAGKTNSQVAAAFITAKNGASPKTFAQVFGTALAVYVTSSTTGTASCVNKFGFNFGAGTGGKLYNVGSNGAAIGLTNNTSYTVLQLLQKANALFPWSPAVAGAINNIFDGINQSGDIS